MIDGAELRVAGLCTMGITSSSQFMVLPMNLVGVFMLMASSFMGARVSICSTFSTSTFACGPQCMKRVRVRVRQASFCKPNKKTHLR